MLFQDGRKGCGSEFRIVLPGWRLTAPPVVGGVLLGMEQVGLNGRAIRERLIETTKVLLNSSGAATLLSVG